MSAAAFRTALVTALVLALSAGALSPAAAAPNDGRYKRSGEALKQALADDCAAAWNFMVEAERKAEALVDAGKKKASKEASKEADDWWAYGVRKGCSWAK